MTQKGLRGDVLLALKREGSLTARDLAERLDVSPNAIRHHLKELTATALVTYGREQRGLGAPTFAYRLSSAGEALFPKRYEQTLVEVLEGLAGRQGRGAAIDLLDEQYTALTRRLSAELVDAAPAERMAVVTQALSDAGYMAEWNEASGAFQLAEHNCAIRAVAERFPEVCAAEVRFLETVLGAAVERRQHIVGGCNACEYAITFGPTPLGTEPS